MTASSTNRQLDERLKQVLGGEQVHTGTADFTVDGVEPALVCVPATQADVAAALAAASEIDAAVIAFGGGSNVGIGMPPARYDAALDMRRLDRVVEYEPADLTITAEAGIRLADLQSRLRENGQWLPLDPAVAPEATIGGILAVNASGPARVAHGTARDLVIGMSVATADGQVVKSGGRVVKNVAGYDMAKLHIGAHGTLGVILQVSFKVAPLPLATRTVVASGRLEGLLEVARSIRDAALPANGLIVRYGDGEWSLQARFAGSASAVERSERDAAVLCQSACVSFENAGEASRGIAVDRPSLRVRASVRPSDLQSLLAEGAKSATEIIAYAGVGTAFMTLADSGAISTLRSFCEERGGALVLEAAPVDVKREIGVWGERRGDFTLMRRLKQEFDRKAILSPGRFVGGL